MNIRTTLGVLFLAGTAFAQGIQMPLPAFTNTYSYSGHTRGFYFQAPSTAPFIIAGLRVPDESGHGTQHVEVIRYSAQPVSSITGTQLFYSSGQPSANIIPTSITVNPGEWIGVLGGCGDSSIMHSSYGAGAFASDVLGAPVTLYRLLTQTNIAVTGGNQPTSGFVSASSIGRVEVYVTPSAGFILPPELVAVAEAFPGTGTLGTDGGTFRDNEFLRYGFNDQTGVNAGLLIWNALNVGVGGSAPIGTTPQIPGLQQVWAGSTPAGTAVLWGPSVVGSPDPIIPIPAGVFSLGDTVRMQGIVLDSRVTNPLPINPTLNTIEFRHTDCLVDENFDNLANGVGNYPTNWTNGGGTQEWRVNSGGTSSSNTGPTAAFSGPKYMYCETSTTTGATYIMNTDVYASNTFVNNTLNFQLSRIGATINVLEVRMDDGSGTFSTLLATYTGPEPSGQEWTAESIPLPTPLPANVQFQFSYARGTSFTGDIAIDSFCLR